MGAWNRWCAEVSASGGGRLHPVGHVTLRDAVWLDAQLGALSRAGVRMAMVAPAPVDGRPLSHRDLDAVWGAFVEHGVTPTFHVADQPHAFDAGWYADVPTEFVSPLDSVMLSTPPALAVTDLVVNGVFARHPDLRVGVVELGATWVPHYLRMLDGGWAFTSRINGRVPWPLDGMPSDYVRRHVRVAAFSYEDPQRLIAAAGDVFMACSDYPHAEGTATPVADYEGRGVEVGAHDALFRDNAAFLLHAADGGRVAPPASAADTGWLATRNR
jgi:predicted TIM-barrel fold metal-dependent hydrolase